MREGFHALMAHMQLVKRLILPVHDYLGRARAVAFLHQHLHKLRLIQRGQDHDFLTLFNVHARACDKLCIAAQNGFFH